MTSKKIHLHLLIMCAALCMFSCKKYLEKKSNTSFVTPSKVGDLQALLDKPDYMNYGTPILGEISSDNYFLLDANYDTRTEMTRNAYRWIPFDYTFPNDWSNCYNPIYTSNLCLETLGEIPITPQNNIQWENIKGSALFFRAYNFLHLAWIYSKAYDETSANTDLGIVLRLTSDFNVPSARATVKESYERILTDAKESLLYLPERPQHVMRPSKAAAYGLLARTYLSMRNYDSALKYSSLALSINSSLLDFNSSEVDKTSTTPFQMFNKETIFFSYSGNAWLTALSKSIARVDTLLFNSYDNNDLRKSVYYATSGSYKVFNDGYSGSFYLFTGLATDEMYLTRAECYARLGDKGNALNDLNTLLGKRWKTGSFASITTTTPQEALNVILTERRKELVKRGLRWMDIKRLNKDGANIILKRIIKGEVYTLPPNDDKFALPLPKDIIDLTGMSQN